MRLQNTKLKTSLLILLSFWAYSTSFMNIFSNASVEGGSPYGVIAVAIGFIGLVCVWKLSIANLKIKYFLRGLALVLFSSVTVFAIAQWLTRW